MARVLRFAAPRKVETVPEEPPPPGPGRVRVRTIASGVSAGTELTAFRGTNPYLTYDWDPDLRLFRERPRGPTARYPVDGWGYSEVGRVVETGPPAGAAHPDDVTTGDVVWGMWGHRTEAVVDASALRGHRLPGDVDPATGCFVRVGAIALNAVLAAHASLGSVVAILGQGVIGLLATRYAVLSGATVIAVEGIPRRQEVARRMGAHHVLAPGPELPVELRRITRSTGVDAAVEMSGTYGGLQSATRLVGPDGVVVAAGFYQGEGALRLGEEFHHNRVQIIASQIGSVPSMLRARWDVERLQRTVVELLLKGEPQVLSLISHRYPLERAAEAYALLDTAGGEALQVLLEMS